MSLQIWLPLNRNLNNHGLSDIAPMNSGATITSDGKLGNCYTFDGVDDFIKLGTITLENTWSFCFWVRRNEWLESWGRYFGFTKVGDGNTYVGMCENANSSTKAGFHIYKEGKALHDSYFTFNLNEWYHVAMTYDGNIKSVYINGILAEQVTVTGFATGDYIGEIGCYHNGNYSSQHSSCSISDFRYYDECISQKMVKEISKGLVCHYKLSSQYETGQKNIYSGDYAEGKCHENTNTLTVTKLENERGYNYKLSSIGTGSNYWASFRFPYFTFTVGKTYVYSCKVRCHSTNVNFTLRAARSNNDWVTRSVNVLANADGEWHEYYVWQTINETYDRNGSTVTCAPCMEFYTENLSTEGTEYFTDFDLKDVQVIESTEYVPFIDNTMVSTTVSDCSGYGNDGIVSGNILRSKYSPRYSGSYDFNGTGYIKNDTFDLTTTEFTVSFWIKMPSSITSQHFLFGTFDSWCNNGIASWRDTGSLKYSILIKSDIESTYSHTYFSLTADTWTHVVIVYTGTQYLLYKDGALDYTVAYGSNGTVIHPTCYVGNSLYINTPSSETDESSVSDFRIYVTALSAEDVKALYSSPISLSKDGSLFACEFEEVE